MSDERETLIARADKYLNTGSGEWASDIMRDMAEFIRRLPAAAATAGIPPSDDAHERLLRVSIAQLRQLADDTNRDRSALSHDLHAIALALSSLSAIIKPLPPLNAARADAPIPPSDMTSLRDEIIVLIRRAKVTVTEQWEGAYGGVPDVEAARIADAILALRSSGSDMTALADDISKFVDWSELSHDPPCLLERVVQGEKLLKRSLAALRRSPSGTAGAMREALLKELRITSENDYRSWSDIERAFRTIAAAPQAQEAKK